MLLLGVMTSDFAVYYEVVAALRGRGIPFLSLVSGEDVPVSVAAVITTAGEAAGVDHPRVIPFTSLDATLAAAEVALRGRDRFMRVVVGIDPGDRPGIAVLGDGQVIAMRQARAPDQVGPLVSAILLPLQYDVALVRIGHGAPSVRDRIINQLLALNLQMELVDETRTTPSAYKTNEERDVHAAKAIALARGTLLHGEREVLPSEGELRDIQRKSRLASSGAVTISRTLARAVARGEMTLDQAVRSQKDGAPGLL